jgi:hypothetical protein
MRPVGFGSPFVPGTMVVIEPMAAGTLDGLTFSVNMIVNLSQQPAGRGGGPYRH